MAIKKTQKANIKSKPLKKLEKAEIKDAEKLDRFGEAPDEAAFLEDEIDIFDDEEYYEDDDDF